MSIVNGFNFRENVRLVLDFIGHIIVYVEEAIAVNEIGHFGKKIYVNV